MWLFSCSVALECKPDREREAANIKTYRDFEFVVGAEALHLSEILIRPLVSHVGRWRLLLLLRRLTLLLGISLGVLG